MVDTDEDLVEAAKRELEERTGFAAGRAEHLITFQAVPGTIDAETALFVGHEPDRVSDPIDDPEVMRADWVPLSSVPGLIASGDIWNAGTLIALLSLLGTRD